MRGINETTNLDAAGGVTTIFGCDLQLRRNNSVNHH